MLRRIVEFTKRIHPDNARIELIRRTLVVYATLFILWGLYRLLLRLPLFIEEMIIKPFIFLPPALSVIEGEDRRPGKLLRAFGFHKSGIVLSIYLGLTLGVSYFLAVGLGRLVFSGREVFGILHISGYQLITVIVISIATAVWEQMIFSGFFLLRFQRVLNDEWRSVTLTAVLFTLLHLPILVLDGSFRPLFVVIQLVLIFLVGFGNAVLMLRTKNVIAPILSHAFWAVALQLVV